MSKGKLIVIEGACDGIGKTTQFNMLCNHLEQDGYKVFHHHFPTYDTYHGEGCVQYLKGEFGTPNELSPYFVNCLYAYDRAIAWYKELKQLYDNGEIIILDRYTTSSLIYQSVPIKDIEKRKEFIDFVIDFEYQKIGIKEPDCVIFLCPSFELAMEMKQNRTSNDGVANDIHESNLEFMKKVYDNSMFIADYLNWEKVDCQTESQMQSKEEIHNQIYSLVKKKIK